MEPSRSQLFRDVAARAGTTLLLSDVERAYEIVDFAIKMKSSVLRSRDAKLDFYYSINTALCNVLGIQRSLPVLHPNLVAEFSRRRRWLPFPDVENALRQLVRKVPLYILANWDSSLPLVVRDAGLERFFHNVVASEMLGFEKPERACFDTFITRTSLAPSTTLYVGNEYVADVIGARHAGLTPLLVDRSGKMRAADCVRITSLAQLTPVLHGHLLDQAVLKDGTSRRDRG
jgi:putative hydrolase of the HAD superfamily